MKPGLALFILGCCLAGGRRTSAAQEFFLNGKPPKHSTLPAQPGSLVAEPPSLAQELHNSHTNRVGVGVPGEISFPYAFPEAGSYAFGFK